nr:PREDICTED: wall-associated receptor kinase-like 8 isoform X1 [Nicotiana tabacum]
MKQCCYSPYFYQPFNEYESPDWANPYSTPEVNHHRRQNFRVLCQQYSSYKFPILPVIDGVVKPCSYSELEKITDFKTENLIQMTQSGRLFRGTITEGSVKRSVIVKTWDLHLPAHLIHVHRPFQFCDEMELYETANAHQYLVKLSRYCCEKRLAAVYDEEFTTVLSDVLLADDFGWEKRINVATQLADLLTWLHKKKIAVGSVTASCIMIDKEVSIKVFDFGNIDTVVNEDSEIALKYLVGRGTPEIISKGKRTLKSDVYIFGLLLMELISKTKFDSCHLPDPNEDKPGGNFLVHECFEEVDYQTAAEISKLTCCCLDLDPGNRPTMKSVFDTLVKLRVGGKRKRDENEAKIE